MYQKVINILNKQLRFSEQNKHFYFILCSN